MVPNRRRIWLRRSVDCIVSILGVCSHQQERFPPAKARRIDSSQEQLQLAHYYMGTSHGDSGMQAGKHLGGTAQARCYWAPIHEASM